MLAQMACALFFAWDVVQEWPTSGHVALFADTNMVPELAATLVLIIGIMVEGQYIVLQLRRQARAQRALNVAAGELHVQSEH